MAELDGSSIAWRLAVELAKAPDERLAASAIARAAATLAQADAARVWIIDRVHGFHLAAAWPDSAAEDAEPPDDLARAIAFQSAVSGKATSPSRSRLVLPLLTEGRPFGGVELLESAREHGPFSRDDSARLGDLVLTADSALVGIRKRATEQKKQFDTVARLIQIYGVSRSLSAVLELSPLTQAIVSRAQSALGATAAYLWMPDTDHTKLAIAAIAGPNADALLDWETLWGEGLAGTVAAEGELIALDDASDLQDGENRPDVQAGLDITQLGAVPLKRSDGSLLGVLEVVFVAHDLENESVETALLREIAEVASIALQNAERLDAVQRATDLGTLLEVVQELGSSLSVSTVAVTLVHKAAAVLDYSRAAVGLRRGGAVAISAMSGQSFVDQTLPETKSLTQLMTWLGGLSEGLYVVQQDDGTIDTPRPEAREKFRAYFAATGARSFLAIPLHDDQGSLGVFTLESPRPYSFHEREIELAGLLAAQAAVSIRNATLHEQIPMMRVFRPLARWKERADGLAHRRGRIGPVSVAALLLALMLIPFPLRVAGQARVLPLQHWPLSASADGRVAQVFVREGDRLEAGQLIAVLDDTEARSRLLELSTRVEMARREVARLRAGGRTADAAAMQAELAGLEAEQSLGSARLDQTRLKAPVAGVVATPRIEERAGTRVAAGEVFCELVEPGALGVEVAVSELDAGLLGPGMSAKIKLNAFATRAFSGRLERVGVAAVEQDGERVFLAHLQLDEAAPELRPGMTGRAKISTRRASLARVIFRRPARWIWNVLWSWLP